MISEEHVDHVLGRSDKLLLLLICARVSYISTRGRSHMLTAAYLVIDQPSWLSAAFGVNAADHNLTTQPPDRKAKQWTAARRARRLQPENSRRCISITMHGGDWSLHEDIDLHRIYSHLSNARPI